MGLVIIEYLIVNLCVYVCAENRNKNSLKLKVCLVYLKPKVLLFKFQMDSKGICTTLVI